MFNILTDGLIRTTLEGRGTTALSLPDVYEALGADQVTAFPALRRHQHHAWHAFLAQLGTIATQRSGRPTPARSAQEWRSNLRRLTNGAGEDEAWELVQPDESKPAFLQPAMPEGAPPYKRPIRCPDDLDMLVTAANHDVKHSIARNARPDDWIMALVSIQTMAKYDGNGKMNIVRMNQGLGSRPGVGLAPAEGGTGAHVMSDIRHMLAYRDTLLTEHPEKFDGKTGIALVWTEPWDGNTSIPLDGAELDPYFIEVSRRIRLATRADGSITARDTSTDKRRIEGKSANGIVGDFWTPINRKRKVSLTLNEHGFTYRKLADLLFSPETWDLPGAMQVGSHERGSWRVVARCLAGGQGGTSGYHEETEIAFSPETAKAMAAPDERAELAEIAKRRIADAAQVEHALDTAMRRGAGQRSGTKDPSHEQRALGRRAVGHLQEAVTRTIFRSIDEEYRAATDEERTAARTKFGRHAVGCARRLLNDAAHTGSRAGAHRHRRRNEATRALEGRLREKGSPLRGCEEILSGRGTTNDDSEQQDRRAKP